MALRLDPIDDSTFWWDLSTEEDVRFLLRPLPPGEVRDALRSVQKIGGAQTQTDETFNMLVRTTRKAIQDWEGIELGGKKAECTPENIETLVRVLTGVAGRAVSAASDEYEARHRTLEKSEGNSTPPHAGQSSTTTTAVGGASQESAAQ